ncbi:MAG: protein kinase [Acidobacteriota bacterium]
MSLAPGTRFGPYEVVAQLGAGGMGEVYRAHDAKLNRDVAIKILPEALAADPAALVRFEREAQAVAALSHPNILSIFDFGREGATAYAVMELLEGETLRVRLEHGALPARKVIDLAVQVGKGLAAAHEKGIVHRDLKPENIFVTGEGVAKILDFGVAKRTGAAGEAGAADGAGATVETSLAHTGPGMVMGTVGYMSPEQVRGEVVDHRSDIFAFGVVLYEMVTGRRAFARETAAESLAAILKEDPPDIASGASGAVPALQRIVQHCLEKKPAERFRDAHDLVFALETISSPSTESNALVQASRRPTLARVAAWSAVLAMMALAVGGSWWWSRKPSSRPTYTQVTFRRGNVLRARFTSDGQNIVYSAAWDGRPCEIFLSRLDGSGVRAIGLPGADLMAVNGKGELLILVKSRQWTGSTGGVGTLALASLDGGTPKELLAHVLGADFGPDGQSLAVAYQGQDGPSVRLDYPLGTHLLASVSENTVGNPRVSPQGDRVALLMHPGAQTGTASTLGTIAIVDRAGKRRDVVSGINTNDDYLAWSRDGREIYFATTSGLMAVDMAGAVRQVTSEATPSFIHDVSAQGALLLERERGVMSPLVRAHGVDLDLGWQDQSSIAGFSRDGSMALLFEQGGGASHHGRPFLRRMDGSAPKVLEPGLPLDLSPAGDIALVATHGDKPKLLMVPTGLGAPKQLGLEGWDVVSGRFSDDGKDVYAAARQTTGEVRILRLPTDGSRSTVLPACVQNEQAIAPDGKRLICIDVSGRLGISSEAGERPTPLPWALESGETIVTWNRADHLLVAHPEDAWHLRLEWVAISTGRRTLWQRFAAPDPATTIAMIGVKVSGDGGTVGYTCQRVLVSDLIVVEGLK